jgi:hypothetical protein
MTMQQEEEHPFTPPKKKSRMSIKSLSTFYDSALYPRIKFESLVKHSLNVVGTDSKFDLSPAALHSNRVACVQGSSNNERTVSVYFASGRRVFVSNTASQSSIFDVSRPPAPGKGGVAVPHHAECKPIEFQCVDQLSLPNEIQSLHATDSILAAADPYGRAVIASLESLHPDEQQEREEEQKHVTKAYQLQVPGRPGEAGWAGISVAHTVCGGDSSPPLVAVARHFQKDITIFDGPIPSRTIYTTYHPNAVELLPPSLNPSQSGGSHLVAVAEGPQLSLWDVRIAGRGARVAKMCPKPHAGQFYCMAVSQTRQQLSATPLFGGAGAERSVMVYEPRTWKMLDRWNNCLKYEITSLHFVNANPGYCVAGGLDYEVIVGPWATKTETKNSVANSIVRFRGDSRWLGLSKAVESDVVAGLTASKSLYIGNLAE